MSDESELTSASEEFEETDRPCEDLPPFRRSFLKSLAIVAAGSLITPDLNAQDCCDDTSCEGAACESACQDCQSGCEVGCQDGCEVSCQTGPCESACQTDCMIECQYYEEMAKYCQTYCQDPCQNNCQGGCQDYGETC